MDSLIAIGSIRTAWGVKGWLKLSSHSGEWDHFASLESVVLRPPRGGRDQRHVVEEFRVLNGQGMFKLKGIDTPEAGKRLANFDIMVPRSDAAPLGEDEWYLSDLVGLTMTDDGGRVLGRIVGIIESSDDLLEVSRDGGGLFYVPFRKAFVAEPDLEAERIVLTAAWLADES